MNHILNLLKKPFWAITKKAAMNFHVLVFIWACAFISIGLIPRSHMVGICLMV